MDERDARSDWRRVEACLLFGVRKWAVYIAAVWVTYRWLAPISRWLWIAAVVLIGVIYEKWFLPLCDPINNRR